MRIQRSGVALVMVAVALLLGACGSEATTSTSETTLTTIAPTTTVPPPTTTTTLGPGDIVKIFIGAISSPDFRGDADVTTELRADEIVITGTGRIAFDGGNSYAIMDFLGTTNETLDIDGVKYTSRNGGPWVSDEVVGRPFGSAPTATAAPGADLELAVWMQTVATLTHRGEVADGDLVLHRLEPANGAMNPAALGFGDDENVTVEATFWARDDGQPHAIDLTIDDWSDPEITYTLSLRMEFTTPDPEQVVEAPTEHLYRHSSDLGFTIGYPRNWDVVEERSEFTVDYFLGIQGDELHVYRNDLDKPGVESLNGWLDGLRMNWKRELGAEFGEAGEAMVNEGSARYMSFRYEDDDFGSVCGAYLVTQVTEDVVVDFIYYCGYSDDEDAALAKLLDLATTFSWEA